MVPIRCAHYPYRAKSKATDQRHHQLPPTANTRDHTAPCTQTLKTLTPEHKSSCHISWTWRLVKKKRWLLRANASVSPHTQPRLCLSPPPEHTSPNTLTFARGSKTASSRLSLSLEIDDCLVHYGGFPLRVSLLPALRQSRF